MEDSQKQKGVPAHKICWEISAPEEFVAPVSFSVTPLQCQMSNEKNHYIPFTISN
jgi:hypothetical protein